MYFTISDAAYWYDIQGEGPPVVLLHGFTGSTTTWNTFIARWKEQFRLLVVDLPGHGKTVIHSPRTMEDCCSDIQKLLHHLQLPKVHIVGYSMGGRTALSFAMLFPEQVASLILESASPGLASSDEQQKRKANDEKLAQRIEQEGIKNFVDFWEDIPLFETQKCLPDSVAKSLRNERLGQTEEGLVHSLRFMGTGSQPSWWDRLSLLMKPVLLLAGAQDEKFIRINAEMHKFLPTSELKVVDNTGHAIHVEEPEIFGKIVTESILKYAIT